MTDSAVEQTIIVAPLDEVYRALTDFDNYVAWAKNLKTSKVVERDADGQPLLVEFRAAAMGRSTHYVLRYDFADAPRRFTWKLEEGDIMRVLNGSYVLEEADGGSSTDVVYTLEVDLRIPLPGFVKRRAESLIIGTALRDLKAHVEAA